MRPELRDLRMDGRGVYVTETELWIEQARTNLVRAQRAGSAALADCLADHLTHIDLAQIQADLGCGDDCLECS